MGRSRLVTICAARAHAPQLSQSPSPPTPSIWLESLSFNVTMPIQLGNWHLSPFPQMLPGLW